MPHPRIFILFMLALLSAIPGRLQAKEEPEGWRFGGWEFVEINHDFGQSPFFASFYFEHDNLQYRHFDCWYNKHRRSGFLLLQISNKHHGP